MTKDNIDWLISALLDKSNGGSRSGMIIPLVNIKSKKAEEVLLQLLVEENPGFGVILQAIEGLGKLKSQLAREKISTFLNHQNKDYKNAAKKALLRIDKS